jgi:hypothetical protein
LLQIAQGRGYTVLATSQGCMVFSLATSPKPQLVELFQHSSTAPGFLGQDLGSHTAWCGRGHFSCPKPVLHFGHSFLQYAGVPLESVSLFIFLEGIFNLFCSFLCFLHPVIEVQVLGPPWSQVWLADFADEGI